MDSLRLDIAPQATRPAAEETRVHQRRVNSAKSGRFALNEIREPGPTTLRPREPIHGALQSRRPDSNGGAGDVRMGSIFSFVTHLKPAGLIRLTCDIFHVNWRSLCQHCEGEPAHEGVHMQDANVQSELETLNQQLRRSKVYLWLFGIGFVLLVIGIFTTAVVAVLGIVALSIGGAWGKDNSVKMQKTVSTLHRQVPLPGRALLLALPVWITDGQGHTLPGLLQVERGDDSQTLRPAQRSDILRLVTHLDGRAAKTRYRGAVKWIEDYARIPGLSDVLTPLSTRSKVDLGPRVRDRKQGVVEIFATRLSEVRPLNAGAGSTQMIALEENGRSWFLVPRNPTEMKEMSNTIQLLTAFRTDGGQATADLTRRMFTETGQVELNAAVQEWHQRVPQLFPSS
jgi:hypothetical protein